MRALFIDSRQGGDWSLDLLFSGLVRVLGPENVIDYPIHDKHRTGPVVLTGDNSTDWSNERKSLGFAPGWERLHTYNERQIIKALAQKEIDVIFIDERMESYELYCRLRCQYFNVPVIVVAGHDRFWNESPAKVRAMYGRSFKLMFLDNWCPAYDVLSYARQYNWTANFDHLWHDDQPNWTKFEKKYDICFMGYNSHPNRARYIDHIQKRWGHLKNFIIFERDPGKMEKFIPKKDYFPILRSSRICLNLRGAAANGKAMRFWEIPHVGSYMLSEDAPFRDQNTQRFEFDKHCTYFASEAEMDLDIEKALRDEEWREGIARAGYEHVRITQTPEFKAKEMLVEIEKVLNG